MLKYWSLISIVCLSMSGCTKPESEKALTYVISQEGGILGKSPIADITVDEKLLEKVIGLKGNFLDEKVLSEIAGTKDVYPDSFTYNIQINENGSVKEEYAISESNLNDDQLDFIDTVYEIAKGKK